MERMKNFIPRVFLFFISIGLTTIVFPMGNALGQLRSGGSANEDLSKLLSTHSALPPIGRFDAPTISRDPKELERRQSRERLKGLDNYKSIVDPGVREVNGQSESIQLTFIDGVYVVKPGERPDPDGLPISDTIIVIGNVSSGQAYVNQEHTLVFSEYKVTVQEVLKSDPDSVISPRDKITTWRSGGSLQFPSGHITHFIIAGRGFPEIGTQYLFFLKRPDKTVQDYAISTAYSIKDQVVAPLDGMNYPRSPFEAMAVNDFLSKLRQEISIRREGGNNE